jgi:hypothetical protein
MKKAFIILGIFLVIGIGWIYIRPYVVYKDQPEYKGASLKSSIKSSIRERDSIAAIDALQEKLNYDYKQLMSRERELNLELHGLTDKTKLTDNLALQIVLQEKMVTNREAFLKSKAHEDYTLDTRERLVVCIQDHKDMIKTLRDALDESLKIPDK